MITNLRMELFEALLYNCHGTPILHLNHSLPSTHTVTPTPSVSSWTVVPGELHTSPPTHTPSPAASPHSDTGWQELRRAG